MVLVDVLLNVVTVVMVLLVATALPVIGYAPLAELSQHVRPRIRRAVPYLGVLAATLLVNSVTRRIGPEVSWIIGWEITGFIYGIEGTFVPQLQSLAPPWLVTYFSLSYVYGYVYLLVFPLLAYLAIDDQEPFRKTVVAYTFNYAIGLVCYLLFIAYGPRNLLPNLVDPLLYVNWPRSQILTSEVNVNTNVFPSLHTSLSATVAILAYRTRDLYPWWLAASILVAVSVILSTMVLGIHWATDVVAGLGLAWLSVRLADRIEDRYHEGTEPESSEATA